MIRLIRSLMFCAITIALAYPVSVTAQQFKRIAKQELKGDVKYIKSPGKDYILCIRESFGTAENPELVFEYMVYDRRKKKMTGDVRTSTGYVSWFDSTHIELIKLPGNMVEGQSVDDYTFIVDVKNFKEIEKSLYLEKIKNEKNKK